MTVWLVVIGAAMIAVSIAQRQWYLARRARMLHADARDPNPEVRHGALVQLGRLRLTSYAGLVRDRLAGETDPALRRCLAAVILAHGWEPSPVLSAARSWADAVVTEEGRPAPCPDGTHRLPESAALLRLPRHRRQGADERAAARTQTPTRTPAAREGNS